MIYHLPSEEEIRTMEREMLDLANRSAKRAAREVRRRKFWTVYNTAFMLWGAVTFCLGPNLKDVFLILAFGLLMFATRWFSKRAEKGYWRHREELLELRTQLLTMYAEAKQVRADIERDKNKLLGDDWKNG